MARRSRRLRGGVAVKKRLLVEGFALLKALARDPLDRATAAQTLGIPRREWYRWLRAFTLAGVPLVRESDRERRVWYRLPLRLWLDLWLRPGTGDAEANLKDKEG